MGIKLNTEDELKIINDSKGLINTYIKNKHIWINTYRGKPKALDKNYENYVNINTIIYTTCNLFIMLQTSIPNYSVVKPHVRCKTSLDGFPLDEDDTNIVGIAYLSCILEQLRNTDSIWKCLKKLKIESLLLDIIKKLYNDDAVKYKYIKKRTYIKTTIKENEIMVHNEWTKFNPPLKLFDINNLSLNNVKLDKKPNNLQELSNYYSLKFMSEIDKIVDESSVENNVFYPSILLQSCCLTQLNSEYNNLIDFYTQNALIEKHLANTNILQNYTSNIIQTNVTINKIDEESLPSFANIMFTLEEDLDQETLTELFENYISSGIFNGRKHIYSDDSCILTGEIREKIIQKIYRKDEYYALLKTIATNNLTENKILNNNLNIVNTFQTIINGNPILKQNIGINNLVQTLIENDNPSIINDIWDDFKIQIEIEKGEIIELFNEYDPKKTGEITNILENLGNLNNILAENVRIYGEDKANKLFIEKKLALLDKYIYSYLFNIISKIKNNKSDENVDIPINWKLNKSYADNLKTHVLKDNTLIKKYISSKLINNTELTYINLLKIVNAFKNLKNIYSEEHLYDCSKIRQFSKLTNENLCSIMEFIFIIIVKQMLTYRTDIDIYTKTSTFDSNDIKVDNLSESSNADINADADNDAENIPDIQSDRQDLITTNKKEVYSLIYDILVKIKDYTQYSDKFTQDKINESIEKKSDIEKEQNLKFIEELDKESRNALKTMISLGIDTWKNLSGKEDKELYFDDSKETPDIDIDTLQQTDDEVNELNRQRATELLGENYTSEQFQTMVDDLNRNSQEDLLAQQEGDVMPDDDGDDNNGAEDYDGEY
jgi:hypothetical protein